MHTVSQQSMYTSGGVRITVGKLTAMATVHTITRMMEALKYVVAFGEYFIVRK